MTRPEFVHMADAYRRIAASYDMLGQPYIGDEYRYRADLLVLPDLCGACGMDPTQSHMWLGSPGFPLCRCLLGQDHQQDPIYERQD